MEMDKEIASIKANTSGQGARSGTEEAGLRPYLSPLMAWALSFGCAVGWGAFVLPGTNFLPIAGPLGTILGMLLGAAVMLVVGVNFHYMLNEYPNAGGAFSYASHELGHDHGFLTAWFLLLVYVAIIWANATALPLIFRNLPGFNFQFGLHYRIAGFDIYLGEILLSLSAIFLLGFASMRGRIFAARLQTVMAILLFGGILTCFLATGRSVDWDLSVLRPAFPPGRKPYLAILQITSLAPWAFVGFESISHSAEEFRFSHKKTFAILSFAVLSAAASYIFLALIAAAQPPRGFDSWHPYTRDLGKLSGLPGLPTFFTINKVMGFPGMCILTLTVMAGVGTGLLGNFIAASRLMYSMAKDGMLPDRFKTLSHDGTPVKATLFILLLSVPVPFLGRTAIGWIIDVNTIGASIAYAYASVSAFVLARKRRNPVMQAAGIAGTAFSLFFFLYFLIPNFFSVGALSTESYLILVTWSLLGFLFFRYILGRDKRKRFGRSTVVWIILLFLIFFTSTIWVREFTRDTTEQVLSNLKQYNTWELEENGVVQPLSQELDSEYYLKTQMNLVNRSLMQSSMVHVILILISLFVMFNIYNLMKKRETEMELDKLKAEQSNRAKSTFLSNMSHDIRTPMNAIIGYTELAKKDKCLSPEAMQYLEKIESSSKHLLALINDVLEMSRIESGKMELDMKDDDIVSAIGEVRDLFITQMEQKQIIYTVTAENVTDRMVVFDKGRLNRVLLNLISNSYKFTPEGGAVSLTLRETGREMADEPAIPDFDNANNAASSMKQGNAGEASIPTQPTRDNARGASVPAQNMMGSEKADSSEAKANGDTSTGEMPEGKVEFALYEIRVKDNGMGMSKEFAAHVFEAYERERTTAVNNIQGTGLGMAITKNIVSLMGGTIDVVTEQGKGTEWIIHLSFRVSEKAECESEEKQKGDVNKFELDYSTIRLLLVEDNAVNREIASLILTESGFKLDTAENGQEALDKVASSEPGYYNAVLMDVQMPVMNGYDAAKAIRALPDPALSRIPIIAMTANAFAEDIQAAKDAGMDEHIAKPIDIGKMLETLTNVLTR